MNQDYHYFYPHSFDDKYFFFSGGRTALVGCRHVQVLLLTLGFFCCYAVRVALSISLVAMTKPSSSSNIAVKK